MGQQSRGIKGVRKTRTEAADRESTALMEKGGYSLARVAGKRAGVLLLCRDGVGNQNIVYTGGVVLCTWCRRHTMSWL